MFSYDLPGRSKDKMCEKHLNVLKFSFDILFYVKSIPMRFFPTTYVTYTTIIFTFFNLP